MFIFLVLALLIVPLFLAALFYLTWSLNWPRKMSYYGFKERVKWTLRRHGWTCADLELKPYPVMIRKGNATVMLVCLHTAESMTPLKMNDLDGNRKVAGKKQIVCVTAEPFDEDFQAAALKRRLFVLHYKDLKSFARSPSSNVNPIREYFANSYANRWHDHEGNVDQPSTIAARPGFSQLFADSDENT